MRRRKNPSNAGKSWGPFTSRQLTTIVCVAIVAAVAIPTAALAAVGTFSSANATPAVTGTNSSTAANAKGVQGTATAGGASSVYGVAGSANASTNGVGVNGSGKKWGVLGVSAGTALNASGLWGNASATSAVDHFGVWGSASGVGGIGVKGTGAKYGVYSNGNLGVAAGKNLDCTGCVSPTNLSAAAQAIQPLASGESESGVFGASAGDSTSGLVIDAITFVRPLSASLTGIEDTIFTGFSANCPGVGLAAAGYLCLYGSGNQVTAGASLDTEVTGVVKYWGTTGTGTPYVGGQYTVTSA